MVAMLAVTPPRGWLGNSSLEALMYQKPVVQRFGSFREVTQSGTRGGFGDTSGGIWTFLTTSPSPSTS